MKQLSQSLNIEQREWLLLISACLIKLVSGQSLAGPIYANFMKLSYGLNQRQLDFSIAAMFLGTMLILFSGLFYDRYGARASVAFSGILSSLATTFLTIAMAYPEPLRQHVWLLYFLLFLYGHSFNYSYVAAIGCCMSSFQPSRRGYIMTLLDTCFSLGSPIVAFIYYVVFANMHRTVANQSPVGTLVVLIIFTSAVHLFAYFFLTPVDALLDADGLTESIPILGRQQQQLQQSYTAAGTSSDEDGFDDSSAAPSSAMEHESINRRQQHGTDDDFLTQTKDCLTACCSTRFLPLLLGLALTIGPNLSIILNLTSVTRSLSLTKYDIYYFWVPCFFGVAWRCLIGPLTDRYLPRASQRSAVLLASVICFGAPSVLMLCTPLAPGASPLGVTMTAYVLAVLVAATLYTLAPVIISQTEQRHLFGRLYSVCVLLGSFVALPLMLQFGALYDSHARWTPVFNSTTPTSVTEPECFGQACYMYGGLANAACQFVSIACLAFYAVSLRLAST